MSNITDFFWRSTTYKQRVFKIKDNQLKEKMTRSKSFPTVKTPSENGHAERADRFQPLLESFPSWSYMHIAIVDNI